MPRKKKAEETVETVQPPEEPQAPELTVMPEDEEQPVSVGLASQAVTFQLGGQLYGLPIEVVQEIQQIAEFTPVPDQASALLGLIDLRGTVVPALDLRALVGLEQQSFTVETPMIFCHVRDHLVCLIVDAVEDVVDLPAGCLQPASGLYTLADRMLGMCRLPQGLVLLLDIERLVPDAALAAADNSAGGR